MAAKLSSVAGDNEVVVSDRVLEAYTEASQIRQRALLWSCGCSDGDTGGGLELQTEETTYLWDQIPVSGNLGLDFQTAYRLQSKWCRIHGPEFCEALVTGAKPAG